MADKVAVAKIEPNPSRDRDQADHKTSRVKSHPSNVHRSNNVGRSNRQVPEDNKVSSVHQDLLNKVGAINRAAIAQTPVVHRKTGDLKIKIVGQGRIPVQKQKDRTCYIIETATAFRCSFFIAFF